MTLLYRREASPGTLATGQSEGANVLRPVVWALAVGMPLMMLVAILPDSVFSPVSDEVEGAVVAHVLLEWTGILCALFGAVLAVAHGHFVRKDSYLMVAAVGLFAASITDSFLLLVSTGGLSIAMPEAEQSAVTWVVARTVVALTVVLGVLSVGRGGRRQRSLDLTFWGVSAAFVITSLVWMAVGTRLPGAVVAQSHIARPLELLPMFVLAGSATILLVAPREQSVVGRRLLLLSIFPNMLAQQFALLADPLPYGALFFAAHGAKLLSYASMTCGVVCLLLDAFRSQRVIREHMSNQRERFEARSIALELAQLRAYQNNKMLERVTQEASAAARLKSEFVATVSHEIRTPMNGVLGSAELFELDNLTAQQKILMKTIRSSGNMLLAIVNDILDFEKIDTGAVKMESLPVDLRALMNDVASMASPNAKQRGNTVEVDIGPRVPAFVTGDPHRLRQILLNLANNAAKFTEGGAVSLRVRRVDELGERQCRLVFEVEDTGIGIKDPRVLFMPFKQEDGTIARRFGGTGLGLAICQKLVGVMGGIIAVESRPGEGSLFWFELVMDVATGPLSMLPRRPSVVPLQPVKVLLVEDNPVNQMLAKRMLEKVGCTVSVAADGQQAVDYVSTDTFEIVFMDCQMPVMDGYAATEAIRAMPAPKADVPIVALTANALADDRERCRGCGMNDLLTKPLVRDAIETAIATYVPRMRETPAAAAS